MDKKLKKDLTKASLFMIFMICLFWGCGEIQKYGDESNYNNSTDSNYTNNEETYNEDQKTGETQSISPNEPNYFPELKDKYDSKWINGCQYFLNDHWETEGEYKGCFVEDKVKYDPKNNTSIIISVKIIEKH